MSAEPAIAMAKEQMNKSIAHLESELLKIRTGKANPAMLDAVYVEYYGAPVPLQQVASVSTPDPRTIVVQPWERKTLQDIERAIINANLNLNPQNDGEVIRISVPPLTEERRKELVKQAKSEGETCKVSIRNSRRDANELVKKLAKDGLAEDLAKDAEAKIQSITNDYISKVDAYLSTKEKEIMTV